MNHIDVLMEHKYMSLTTLKCLGSNQPPTFSSVYKSTMCEVPLLRPPPESYLTVKCVNENSNPYRVSLFTGLDYWSAKWEVKGRAKPIAAA